MSGNNVVNQIDRLLDIGLEYQRITGKKFEYKDFLKKTYKHLDENNAHVPKDIKKDIKKRIKRRIKDRDNHVKGKSLAYNVSSTEEVSSTERYNDLRDKDYYGYTDEMRGAVIESSIGAVLCLVPCGATQAIGFAVLGHGVLRVINQGIDYYHSEPSGSERREAEYGGRRYERDRDYSREDLR